jgi:ParB/RepB/Spo0J family partition protein
MITVLDLECTKIVAGNNDRTAFEPVALRELADSLTAHGLAQPITVRPLGEGNSLYEIVAGERRFRASQLNGWTTIPAIVRTMTDEEAAGIMLVENVQRVDLNPMDEARAYQKRQAQFGWSIAEIAKQAKVPATRVRARIALLDLIPEVQILIRGGSLALGYAEAMVDLDANRQSIAMRYFSESRRPTLTEFRALCGELLAAQSQDSLFDFDCFMVAQEVAQPEEATVTKRYPTKKNLPPMKGAVSVGLAFERYIAELMQSGDEELQDAAAVVGTVYDSLIRANLAKPPKDSPLA